MKFQLNLEMADAEIRDLAAETARRGLWELVEMLGDKMRDVSPGDVSGILGMLQQALGQGGNANQVRRVPHAAWVGVPPYGPPPPPYGAPPYGPPPPPYGPPPPPGGRVVPFPNTGPVVEKCFYMEETRNLEAGWGCCRCATYNGMQREACRQCGHKNCLQNTPIPTGVMPRQEHGEAVVTPFPAGPVSHGPIGQPPPVPSPTPSGSPYGDRE